MKTRGIRGGILLSLSLEDNTDQLEETLRSQHDLFTSKVILEVADKLPWTLLQRAVAVVEESGGTVTEVRPAGGGVTPRGETKIISRTIRSGGKVESTGSILVIGDVNSGAELVAVDDIIVLGTLRGVAHAGAGGNEHAFIWAQEIRSPQLRIGVALAQAGSGAAANGPEVAHLRDGNIVLRPWT